MLLKVEAEFRKRRKLPDGINGDWNELNKYETGIELAWIACHDIVRGCRESRGVHMSLEILQTVLQVSFST